MSSRGRPRPRPSCGRRCPAQNRKLRRGLSLVVEQRAVSARRPITARRQCGQVRAARSRAGPVERPRLDGAPGAAVSRGQTRFCAARRHSLRSDWPAADRRSMPLAAAQKHSADDLPLGACRSRRRSSSGGANGQQRLQPSRYRHSGGNPPIRSASTNSRSAHCAVRGRI